MMTESRVTCNNQQNTCSMASPPQRRQLLRTLFMRIYIKIGQWLHLEVDCKLEGKKDESS